MSGSSCLAELVGSTSSRPSLTDDVAPRADHAAEHTLALTEGEVPDVDGSVRPDRATSCGARTSEWLAEHLPAGWMEAIDAGDTREGRARCAPTSTTPSGAPSSVSRASPRPRGRPSTAPGCRSRPVRRAPVNEVLNHYRRAAAGQHHRHRHGRADRHRVGERGRQAAVPPRHRHQRGDLVPALQRAGRRVRRRRARHAGRARRRRVGGERTEGLDLAGAPRPLRDAAGAHRSRPAEAPRA